MRIVDFEPFCSNRVRKMSRKRRSTKKESNKRKICRCKPDCGRLLSVRSRQRHKQKVGNTWGDSQSEDERMIIDSNAESEDQHRSEASPLALDNEQEVGDRDEIDSRDDELEEELDGGEIFDEEISEGGEPIDKDESEAARWDHNGDDDINDEENFEGTAAGDLYQQSEIESDDIRDVDEYWNMELHDTVDGDDEGLTDEEREQLASWNQYDRACMDSEDDDEELTAEDIVQELDQMESESGFIEELWETRMWI